ncbi:MAG: VanZ family protein [Clostridium sp.]|nr:VanZ family protein [Clostridium sp.]
MHNVKTKAIVCWCLTVICMGVIFWLSSRTSTESAEQSGALLQWLIDHFGNNGFTDFIVRKLAHFLEFTGLCFLFNIAWYYTKGKASPVLSVICTSAYAATDEFHQLFVSGRSCELRDWAIDSCGAVAGAIGTMLVFYVVSLIIKKKKCIDTTNN